MRVLHVAAGNLYGGIERVLVTTTHADAARQHGFALAFDGRCAAELRAVDARVQVFGPARFSRPLSVWSARRSLAAQWPAGSFDVAVCHSPWTWLLATPALPPGVVALSAHDALAGTHWTERRVARRPPPLILCNSEYTRAAVHGWLPAVPTAVVRPAVLAHEHQPATRAQVRTEMGVGDSTAVILVTARMERWKGQQELLTAAALLRGDWQIWVAGRAQKASETAYQGELEALPDRLGIASRVRFLGERSDVHRLLAAADIHCQPNTAPEPFGVAFVEALAAGVPVVTTSGGGANEIVTDDCGILVPPRHRAALVSALQRLVDDSELRRTLGAHGPARAAELCDPHRHLQLLEQALLPLVPAHV